VAVGSITLDVDSDVPHAARSIRVSANPITGAKNVLLFIVCPSVLSHGSCKEPQLTRPSKKKARRGQLAWRAAMISLLMPRHQGLLAIILR
jgi:hypothetical protein